MQSCHDYPEHWFERFTGIPESEWDFNMKSLPPHINERAGTFEVIKLRDLYNRVKSLLEATGEDNNENTNGIEIHIRDYISTSPEYFDTSALQFNAKEDCMFQVASNFNCTEIGNLYASPFNGNYLSQLMTDNTQGPSAASGAAYGAIQRLSVLFNEGIDLLEDTSLKNDKVNSKIIEKNIQKKKIEDLDIWDIKIGLQSDTTATHQRCRDLPFIERKDGVRIDQVYTSTCISQNKKHTLLKEKLLKAAYIGTYLSAALRRSKYLYLTMIGGGCFKNGEELISSVVAEVHEEYKKFLSKDCQVILPLYMPNKNGNIWNIQKKTKIKVFKF